MAHTTTPPGEFDSRLDRAFFGHPKGLSTLFFVEFWERFSYYGMKAILAYYLYFAIVDGGLGIDKTTAKSVVMIYGAAVYMLSIIGGYVADRLLDPRRTIFIGGVIIMLGHIALAVPASASAWVGICLVALGTGFLKPNISSIVGQLYNESDPRRDAGYSIFYMSINAGAFVSPFVVAALRKNWGFHAGFAAAAVGMAFALVFYVMGTKNLRGVGQSVPNPIEKHEVKPMIIKCLLGLVVIVLLYFTTGMWNSNPANQVVDTITIIAIVASVGYFRMMYSSPKVTAEERPRVLAYIPLFIGGVFFSMVFEQASGPMAEFAEARTNLSEGGLVTWDPEWFQSINPVCILLFTPLFAWLWTKRAGKLPNLPQKFALGVSIVGLSALMMMWATQNFDEKHLAPVWVLASVFVVQTVAELCLSPVGLSATSLLAPRAFKGQVMALWFMTISLGSALGAQLVKLMGDMPLPTFYLVNAILTFIAAAVLMVSAPWVMKHMRSIKIETDEKVLQQ